ncbi:hypothetical protein CR513_12617, partial [Mucuna pruriens]
MRIDQIFSCKSYLEGKKVKLEALDFTDYALRVGYGECPIRTWEEMKAITRKQFVLSYFHRELHNKLKHFTQGSKSMDDYYKEMEMAMIRANILKDQEATMA